MYTTPVASGNRETCLNRMVFIFFQTKLGSMSHVRAQTDLLLSVSNLLLFSLLTAVVVAMHWQQVAANVVNIGSNLPPMSLTPAVANLPPVSLQTM